MKHNLNGEKFTFFMIVVSAILLTIIVNIYWADMTDYNLAFAIPFSMIFFFPIFYRLTEKFVYFLMDTAKDSVKESFR